MITVQYCHDQQYSIIIIVELLFVHLVGVGVRSYRKWRVEPGKGDNYKQTITSHQGHIK